MSLVVGELFAGVGGLGLGLERAGARVAWQVEINDQARSVLARHWPDVSRHEDVRRVGAGTLVAVDVVAGGFPCQDLSIAGRRAGLGGERSGLWWEFHRIVSELRPRWVFAENVPGLLSSNGGRDMGAVLGSLAQLGYGYAYRVLDARFFGLAQRRARVLIVGCLGDGRRAAQVLLEPEGVRGDFAPRGEPRTDVAGSLAASAGRSRQRLDGTGAFIPVTTHALTAEGFDASEDGTGRGTPLILHALTDSGNGRMDPNGETFVPVGFRWAASAAQSMRVDDTVDPLRAQGGAAGIPAVAYACQGSNVGSSGALRAGHNHTNGVPFVGVRRLTPTECERLQGFPDGWTAESIDGPQSDSARYRQLGNAVPPPMTEWVGRRIAQASA